MPFSETKEGQTHYENDGCGEPEHNSTNPFTQGHIRGYETAVERMTERIKAMPTDCPDRESDEYDAGYYDAVQAIITLLEEMT